MLVFPILCHITLNQVCVYMIYSWSLEGKDLFTNMSWIHVYSYVTHSLIMQCFITENISTYNNKIQLNRSKETLIFGSVVQPHLYILRVSATPVKPHL